MKKDQTCLFFGLFCGLILITGFIIIAYLISCLIWHELLNYIGWFLLFILGLVVIFSFIVPLLNIPNGKKYTGRYSIGADGYVNMEEVDE